MLINKTNSLEEYRTLAKKIGLLLFGYHNVEQLIKNDQNFVGSMAMILKLLSSEEIDEMMQKLIRED